ncbi:hypothetical protein J7L05_06390 [bacterium]|nr:hypothetical protein [bacterium]
MNVTPPRFFRKLLLRRSSLGSSFFKAKSFTLLLFFLLSFLPLTSSPVGAGVDTGQTNNCYTTSGNFHWYNWQGAAYTSTHVGLSEVFYQVWVPNLNGGADEKIKIYYPFVWPSTIAINPVSQCANTIPFKIYSNRSCTYSTYQYFEVADICRYRKIKFARVCYYNYSSPFQDDIDVVPYPGYNDGGWENYLNDEDNYIEPHDPPNHNHGGSCLLIWHPAHNTNTNC